MDPILYEGAIKGDVGVLTTYSDQLEVQVTPNNNSVLHVTAQFLNSSTYVKQIFTLQQSLLWKVNSKGETPLHIAARKGHFAVVKELIECAKTVGVGAAKEMMRMTSENGDTALHEALNEVWNDHLSVVKLLTEEDPEFSHPPNKAGETPLYLAVERGLDHIVSQLVETCTAMGYGGPNGRTALHAAVIQDSEGSTKRLLEWKNSLAKETDIYGWTPLHFAARFGHLLRARQLLVADKSAAYVAAEKDNNNTPLHLTACWGKLNVMRELLTHCPDCWEMLDSRGQNMIHIACRYEEFKVVDYFLENPRFIDLINQKDADGNTPLHLLAASYCNCTFPIRNKDELQKFIMHPKVDKRTFNNDNAVPKELAYGDGHTFIRGFILDMLEKAGAPLGYRDVVKRDKCLINGWMKYRAESTMNLQPLDIKKVGDTHLIVAALVATVTFAAGFTVPGGYDGNEGPNQGMAVLIRKAAFKAFVVSDTVAMVLSICAVFLYFIASLYQQEDKVINRYGTSMIFILLAFGAMVVAFMTGMYAALAHSLGLAIAVCMICGFFFFLFYFLVKRFFVDREQSQMRADPVPMY